MSLINGGRESHPPPFFLEPCPLNGQNLYAVFTCTVCGGVAFACPDDNDVIERTPNGFFTEALKQGAWRYSLMTYDMIEQIGACYHVTLPGLEEK